MEEKQPFFSCRQIIRMCCKCHRQLFERFCLISVSVPVFSPAVHVGPLNAIIRHMTISLKLDRYGVFLFWSIDFLLWCRCSAVAIDISTPSRCHRTISYC